MSTNNLPEGWREVQFGDVTTFTRKPRGLDYSKFGHIPFVPMDLVPIGTTYMNDHELREGGAITSGTYFEDGDVLLARITPSFENGKQVIIEGLPEPFGVGTTEVIPYKAKYGVSHREYLFYFLLRSGVRNDLAGKMEGSTGRQRLKPRTLKDLKIPLPPIDEQRAIANALKSIEDAMQARRQELGVERERKAALLAHLFIYGTRGETTKEDPEIGEVPKSWRVVKLGEVAEGTQYGISMRGEQQGTYPILRMNNLADGGMDVEDLQYVDLDDETFEKFKVNVGDLLFNRTNSYELVGKTSLFEEAEPYVFASYLVRVELKQEEADPVFVNAYLNTPRAQGRLRQLATRGVSQSNINATKLRNFKIPVPTLDEQREIAEVVRACNAKVAALQEEIELHEELFQALLEELMTGQRSALPLVDDGQEVAA